ncbi:MAG: nickel/cobalt transporter [Campylobacter sp.]
MKFGRIFVFLTLCASFIYACALCALYTPTAHAAIKLNEQNGLIKSATITWTFSENFTELTLQSYDENSDKNLSQKEAWAIQKSLLDYIVPRGYLTNIGFYDGESQTQNVFHKTISQNVFLQDNRLNFEYCLQLNLNAQDGRVFVFEIIDREGFFNFKISQDEPFELTKGLFVIPNVNLNTAFLQISSKKPPKNEQKPTLNELIKKQNLKQIDELDRANFDKSSVANATLGFLEKLKTMIKSNKDQFSWLNFAMILAISFIYGLVHAAGPGHAKMLTASYFIATNANYTKAFLFALRVGFLHVLGAFLMVFLSYFFIDSLASNLSKNSADITTKISAVIIVCIAIFMLYEKIKRLFQKPKFSFFKDNKKSKILSIKPHENCSCIACNGLKKEPKGVSEWLIVLASSLVPCPGTILVFVLAFSLNSYFVATLSGIFMALGMSVVIFAVAVFGFKFKEQLSIRNLRFYFEIIALLFMLGLGIFMFYISDKMSVL